MWILTGMATPTFKALDHLMGGDGALTQWVTARRSDGVSWRRIAVELEDETGIDVTHETVRSWFPELVTPAEAAS